MSTFQTNESVMSSLLLFSDFTMSAFDPGDDDSWMLGETKEQSEQDLNAAFSDQTRHPEENVTFSNKTLEQLDLSFDDILNEALSAKFMSDKTLEQLEEDMDFETEEVKLSNPTLNDDPCDLVTQADVKSQIQSQCVNDVQEKNLNMLIDQLSQIDEQTSCDWIPPVDDKIQSDIVHQLALCCPKANRKLAQHLDESVHCKRKLADRMGLSSDSPTLKVMEKRRKMMRRARYSMINQKRRQVNKSNEVKLNEAKKKIGAVQKVYICYFCKFTSNKKENLTESAPNHQLPKSYITDASYFLCERCVGGPAESIASIPEFGTRNFLKQSSIDRRSVLVPEEDLIESCHLVFPPTFFMPNSNPTKSWWSYKEGNPKMRPDLLQMSTVNTGLDDRAVSASDCADAMYEHRLAQILVRKVESSFLKGKVVDMEKRTVKLSPINPNLSKIKGTSDYYQKIHRESQVAFQYFGKTALSVQVEVSKNTSEIWKQYLVEENAVGVVVKTLDGELSYEVHKNHRSLEPCIESCEIVPLREYLSSRNLKDSNLEEPRFLNIVSEHYRRLFCSYTNVICNLDEIRAEKYISIIHFPLNSEPVLKMIVWPEFLANFNRKLVTDESATLVDVRVLESRFDSVLTTEIERADKDSQSQVSEKMSELSNSMYDFTMGSMPSNFNLIKRPVIPRGENWGLLEVTNTTESLFQIQENFIEILNTVPKEHFNKESELKLNDVFAFIKRTDGFQCEMTENDFTVKFPGKNVIKCSIDSVLYSYITEDKHSAISAIYHRALTITRANDDYTLIVKRPHLSSAYISAYNPNILLLAESKCFISFVSTNINSACLDLTIPSRPMYSSQPQYLVDHEEMTLLNGFYLIGGTKFKITHRSTTPIFFDPSPEKLKTYKKVLSHDPYKHFKDQNTGVWYDKILDIHDQYLDRLGNDDLTLMQFCMHYHQGGNDDTEDKGMISETQVSNSIQLISFDGQKDCETLPQVIEMRSGKRMLLQMHPKLIYYPNVDVGSKEFKEIQVLFYYPHRSLSHVQLFMDPIFTAQSDKFPDKTKLEVTRMLLHPLFSLDLYSSL